MLIYEKNNKLNINFDNEISENPDIQIGKDGDKTEVLVDGNSNPAIPVPVLPEDVGKTIVVNEDGSYTLANAGGSNAPLVLEFATEDPYTVATPIADIKVAIETGRQVYFNYQGGVCPVSGFVFNDNTLISIRFSQISITIPNFGLPATLTQTSIVYSQEVEWKVDIKTFTNTN